MIRPWHIWFGFALCVTVVLGAMGWISMAVIRGDEAQERFHREADLEENIRLALWRMDSAMTPVISGETMRPHFIYRSFYPGDQMFACAVVGKETNSGLVPSPLLLLLPPHMILHFQFDAEGKVSSPQVPTGDHLPLARDGCTTDDRIAQARAMLAELQTRVSWESLLTAMGHEKPASPVSRADPYRGQPQQPMSRQSTEAQTLRNDLEYSARQGNVAVVQSYSWVNNNALVSLEMRDAIMKPYWVGTTLVLARKISYGDEEFMQGCWVDWPGLRRWLLESIGDLLPNAGLEPARGDLNDKGSHLLATLPAMLVPGAVVLESGSISSPIRISLIAAWACVLLAALAVASLLLGVLSLSERRAAFVSAVTHELRTPLTTFRMYSEILSKDMLNDEEKQKRYLVTLCTEADRLSHLVENVLSFARIERRGNRGARIGMVGVGALLERIRDRLSDRAEQAGMKLEIEPPALDQRVGLRADSGAVEQILFNLVDNACKYAQGARDPSLRISVIAQNGNAIIRVRDHGPGVSARTARRLFRPFSKSASDAANSAPGVGLGLALSRRLARSMGGDLRLDTGITDGACFELRLPIAPLTTP